MIKYLLILTLLTGCISAPITKTPIIVDTKSNILDKIKSVIKTTVDQEDKTFEITTNPSKPTISKVSYKIQTNSGNKSINIKIRVLRSGNKQKFNMHTIVIEFKGKIKQRQDFKTVTSSSSKFIKDIDIILTDILE